MNNTWEPTRFDILLSLQAEMNRLRASHADLLAAAKAVLTDDSDLQVWADLKDAIAKVESLP